MRLAFFILVFVNLAFYVWSAGFLGGQQEGREPERLGQQISPENIRILPNLPLKADKTESTSVISAAECRVISGLSGEEAGRIEQSLQATEGFAVSLKPPVAPIDPPAHWVLIGNLASREAVGKKQAELKALGVTESRLAMSDAVGPYVLSLGIFSNETLAQDFLVTLNKKGVRSARIVPREKSAKQTQLEVRAAASLLKGLPQTLTAYPAASVSDCPATAEQ
jgi:hypothetical protein